MDGSALSAKLTPAPQQMTVDGGTFELERGTLAAPDGPEHEACRTVLRAALDGVGSGDPTYERLAHDAVAAGNTFAIGEAGELPDLPTEGQAEEGYVLRVTPSGISARGASPAGLLHAAQTVRQLARMAEDGQVPCMTIVDYPEFRVRGIYIEGGQERHGQIVDADYIREQIRRLAEFKMNTLVLECYNLLPYASFPANADEGTLSEEECREIIAESKRYHVTLIPSLQTLAQAYELVWLCDEGEPYREPTAPGLMCPSNPEIYPFIKGLYRDLLTWFDESPIIGVGCSEIDMQWKERYCERCGERVDAGETVRDLLLGHAEKCIEAVEELAEEMGRDVRPLMWGDEFYMYGPGKDWVGIERISQPTVMGHWKYWRDYVGIGGLLERGHDVLGVSAMYNHTFYLADLTPENPPKSWPSMEQTGTINITEMLQEGKQAQDAGADFWGAVTASFSKHRLRAFDSMWYGFALNGHASWSHTERPIDDYQADFTQAFARHYYDARTDEAAAALADAWERLDRCKSRLELANQTLGDVVGVYDTQEAGYQNNTLMGAFRKCGELTSEGDALRSIRDAADEVVRESGEVMELINAQRTHVGRVPELADLWLAGEKISAHAERQILMIDAQAVLTAADGAELEVRPTRATADCAESWAEHRVRMERIDLRTRHLYSRGDPLGLSALMRDVDAIETHLRTVAEPGGVEAEREVLLSESFEALDEGKWITLGDPVFVAGHLETRAPGGWENYCGVATRQAFGLEPDRPLVVEFELTPVEMGQDSQLLASSDETGKLVYQFTLYGPGTRLGIYTQSADGLEGAWTSTEPGWKPRSFSPDVEVGVSYVVRAEITSTTWRVTVRERGESPWQPPLWDTGAAPMNRVDSTRLLFADVEPEDSGGASVWGPITIWRAR